MAHGSAGALIRWRGFTGTLQTEDDLLRKMAYDYERVLAAPGDPYPAFDFFVAAEAMVDWRWPTDKKKQDEVRRHEPAATVSHLASGAKHFEATARRHQSVRDVSTDEHFDAAFDPSAFQSDAFQTGHTALVVTMSDERRVDASELAALVLAYWRTELGPAGIHARRDSEASAAE